MDLRTIDEKWFLTAGRAAWYLLVLAPLAYLVWRSLRQMRRGSDLPRCGRCNYAVVGLTGTVCPECGGELTEVGVIPAGKAVRPPVVWLASWTVLFLLVGTFDWHARGDGPTQPLLVRGWAQDMTGVRRSNDNRATPGALGISASAWGWAYPNDLVPDEVSVGGKMTLLRVRPRRITFAEGGHEVQVPDLAAVPWQRLLADTGLAAGAPEGPELARQLREIVEHGMAAHGCSVHIEVYRVRDQVPRGAVTWEDSSGTAGAASWEPVVQRGDVHLPLIVGAWAGGASVLLLWWRRRVRNAGRS